MPLNIEWNYRAFGQSSDIFFQGPTNGPGQNGINHVWINPEWLNEAHRYDFIQNQSQLNGGLKPNIPVRINKDDKIVLESRAGKMAVGHFAGTAFYTKLSTGENYILTAKVTKLFVVAYPSSGGTVNAQTGGMMAAFDVVGVHRANPPEEGYEELPAITNYAGIGFTGRNGLYDQTGLIYSDGCKSETFAIGAVGPNAAVDTITQQLGVPLIYKLERKDSGFFMTLYNNNGIIIKPETLIYDKADLVERIDPNMMYWGFFAARETRMLIENLNLCETKKANIYRSKSPGGYARLNPEIELISRIKTGLADYNLILRTNCTGKLKVWLNNNQIFNDNAIDYEEVRIYIKLTEGENLFKYNFLPSKGSEIQESFNVSLVLKPSAKWRAVWAGLESNGDGSGIDKANSTTIQNAIQAAEPGQVIYIIDGDYRKSQIILSNTLGTLNNRVKIQPEPEVEFIKLHSLIINGSYWHVERFITGGTGPDDRGGVLSNTGDFNIIENCIHEFSTNGIHVAGYTKGLPSKAWAKENLFLNCTSRYNKDSALNNADGFHSIAGGPRNILKGCIAHHNVDDGFDAFTRVFTGPSYTIIFENCIAYANGKNGFKLGGEGQPSDNILKNCIAFDNVMANFSDNFNPGGLRLYNCIAIDALDQNYLFRKNPIIKPENKLINSISLRTNSKLGKNDSISGTIQNSSISFNGKSQIDDYTITVNDFVSLERPKFYEIIENGGHLNGIDLIKLVDIVIDDFIKRDKNGNIILDNFLKLKESSPLAKMGVGIK